MILSIDGLEIAKFNFQDVTEEFFINFLNKYGI
jgi:hypothetical protein